MNMFVRNVITNLNTWYSGVQTVPFVQNVRTQRLNEKCQPVVSRAVEASPLLQDRLPVQVVRATIAAVVVKAIDPLKEPGKPGTKLTHDRINKIKMI
jgi:hypothetical protein